jgi:hypothetical protein
MTQGTTYFNVTMSVLMLNLVRLGVVMLNVVKLCASILIVMAHRFPSL